jgi:hypothetical protein
VSASHDDGSMRDDRELDDRRMEHLLSGRADTAPQGDRELARALDSIRASAAAGAGPEPGEELLRVFAEGVTPAPAPSARTGGATREPPALPGRGRLAVRRPLTKLAGLSLLVKLSLGGAAVAAATVGGAGAAGVLPG